MTKGYNAEPFRIDQYQLKGHFFTGLRWLLMTTLVPSAWAGTTFSDSNEFLLDLRTQAFKEWLANYYSSEVIDDPAYGSLGADGDGDSYNNRFEYLADTNPNDFWSVIRVFFFVDETVSLRVSPASERAEYAVSFSDDLEVWNAAEDLSYQRIGDEIVFDLIDFPENRFYRVILFEP